MSLLKGVYRALLARSTSGGGGGTPEVNFLDTLSTMEAGHRGMPFVVGSPSDADLQTMANAHRGQPYVVYRA
jgi:hypothetical protein